MRFTFALFSTCMAVVLTAADAAQLRSVAERAGPAVIAVRVVSSVNLTIMGQNRALDQETDAVGVVVDPSGLCVVMLNDLDPSAMFKAMLGGNPMIKIDSQLKEASYRLADGSEVPAELAIKDAELGLAVLRPKTAGTTYPALAPQAGAKIQLGDRVTAVSRAPRFVTATVLVNEILVNGAVAGPQPYAIVSQGATTSAAICNNDGQLIGVLSSKSPPAKEANKAAEMDPMAGLTSAMEAKNLVPVAIIRPADALRKLIDQAKAAPATPAVPVAPAAPATKP
ncbi:MAG: serine protease [Planctomycetota bacterium]